MKKCYFSPGRLHPLALALTCVLGAPVLAQNLPTGFTAITGVNAPTTVGKAMTVTQTAQRGIAQWQGFSIANGYTVNVVQPGASSVLLNRVVGGNASTIAGALNANGHIYLINPNGVLFSRGSSVNAGGLIASTLNLSDKNFLAGGRLTFERANANTATVRNEGAITAAPGGTVALLGARVSNDGSISAPGGTVGLVSARKVNVDFDGDGLTTFTIPADSQASGALVDNSGSIDADGGHIALQAASRVQEQVVNQRGVLRARSISSHGGQIVLGGDPASGNAVQIGGSIDVSGDAAGGSVQASAAQVQITGAHINANGNSGGTVAVDATHGVTLAPDTRITAEGASGAGGSIAISGQAGDVIVGASTGQTPSGAWLSAASSGGPGGNITVSGRNVGLFSADTSPNSAWLDVSGAGQGGNIAIRAHADPGVASSGIIAMDSGIGLHADAMAASGNGGNITLLGDSIVRAHGTLTARAGAAGGDGGMVETSAPALELAGIRVDASAPAGAAGNWLLDPYDVTITHGGPANSSTSSGPPNLDPFDPETGGTTVYDGDINVALNQGNNVTITTGTGIPKGDTPPPNGDITFVPDSTGADVAISKTDGTGPATLTLNAAHGINTQGNPSIKSTAGLLNVNFAAGGGDPNGYSIFFQGSIATNGGTVNMNATGNNGYYTAVGLTNSQIATNGGNVTIQGAGSGAGVYLLGSTIDTRVDGSDANAGGGVLLSGSATGTSGGPFAGVNLSDNQGTASHIYASTGSVRLVGNGTAVSGVQIGGGSGISTTSGSIVLSGKGSSAASLNTFCGVHLDDAHLSSDSGTISLQGLYQSGYNLDAAGVLLTNGTTVTTGSSDIDIAGSSNVAGSAGVRIDSSSSISGGRNVALRAGNDGTADALAVDGTVNAVEVLNLRPGEVSANVDAMDRPNDAITLGGPGGGGFSVSSDELSRMTASTIVVGSNTHAADITVSGVIGTKSALTLQNDGGGSITLNAPVSAPLLGLVSAGNITQNAAAGITADGLFALSSGGNVDLQSVLNRVGTLGGGAAGSFAYAGNSTDALWIGSFSGTFGVTGYDAAGHAPVDITASTLSANGVTVHTNGDLNVFSTVNSTSGVDLTAGGNFTLGNIPQEMLGLGSNIMAGGPVQIQANRIQVIGAYQGGQITTSSGFVKLDASGVTMADGSRIATNGGDVTINGSGGTVSYSGQISTNGGNVAIKAVNPQGQNGTLLYSGQIATSGGDVTLDGTGYLGVTLSSGSIDTRNAANGGAVTITGEGNGGEAPSLGVEIHDSVITASTGDVQIRGVSTGGTGLMINCSVGNCISTTSGAITLSGVGTDSVASDTPISGVVLSGNGVSISSVDGAIAVHGLSQASSGGSTAGLGAGVALGTGISTTGHGDIDVAGSSESGQPGVSVWQGSAINGGGNVVLRASHDGQGDALVVDGTVRAGNALNLRPGGVDANGNAMDRTGDAITLGGLGGAGFSVSSDALSRMSAPTIVVGSSAHAADITMAGAIDTSSALTLQNGGGGNIRLEAPVSVSRLGLVSAGGITQAAGADITAGELLAQSSGGNVTLNNGNNVDAVGGSAAGGFSYTNANALTIGPVTVTGYDAAGNAPMSITADALSAGQVQVSALGGDLTLATAVSSVTGADLVAAGSFQNPGGGPISGPWRVWAGTWNGESRGGLEGSGDLPNLYGCVYQGKCAATASTQQDNHFIYAQQPTATVVINNESRPFGADNPVLTYRIDGLLHGSDQSSITGTLSTQATPSSPPGSYPITGSFTSAAGYAINVVPGVLDVSQPPLPKPPIPEEVLGQAQSDEDSPGYERDFGLVQVCPSLAPSLGEQQGGDMLGHEWLRVRSRHKLTSCIDTARRNGCTDF